MKDSGVYRDGTKTCILLGTAHRRVRIIPLSDTGLEIVTLGITEFEETWFWVVYPITLAAERYLGFAKLHGASEEAFIALQNLVRGSEVPVEERKVYSNGSQMVINISPIDGSNINVVGLVDGKVTIFGLSQKEFGEYKELKNKAKDVAKKFHNFEQIQGAEPQALRLLREVISGKSINYERKVEMAKKKAEPAETKSKSNKGPDIAKTKPGKVEGKKGKEEAAPAKEIIVSGGSRGAPSKIASMKIKVLNKKHGAREGTKRAAWLDALLSSKTVAEAQEKVEGIDAGVVRFAEQSGFISLS